MAHARPTAQPHLPPNDAPADRDAVDPELLALPAPPRGRRLATMTLMALVVVAAMGLTLTLRHDLAFFFAPSTTIDLGDAHEIDPATLVPNSYVRLSGTPMVSRSVHYRRVLLGSAYEVFPLAGQRTIYVQVPAGGGAALARHEFSGRLVTFSQLGGRMATVQGYLSGEMGLPVSGSSYLLLADETPGSYAWALLLALLCVAFVAVDVLLLLRWFRPLPRTIDTGELRSGEDQEDGAAT